jgi:hypothetical protein
LNEINFSTGDEHSRFVSLDNVIRATRAALEAGLVVAIMVETVRDRRTTKETIEDHPEFRQLVEAFPVARSILIESPWMPLSPTQVQEYPPGTAIDRSTLAMCRGCDSVLSTTTVEADGSIRACCGIGMRQIPELRIGHITEVTLAEADHIASDDFLKRWIRVEGPERILAWASSYDPDIKWEGMYAHRCQACHRLYKDSRVREVIAKRHEEKIADVLFHEWLLFHYEGNRELVRNEVGFTTPPAREESPATGSAQRFAGLRAQEKLATQ